LDDVASDICKARQLLRHKFVHPAAAAAPALAPASRAAGAASCGAARRSEQVRRRPGPAHSLPPHISLSVQGGGCGECEAGEESAASVYGYTGTPCARREGRSGCGPAERGSGGAQ
jgi:hypothetical protein